MKTKLLHKKKIELTSAESDEAMLPAATTPCSNFDPRSNRESRIRSAGSTHGKSKLKILLSFATVVSISLLWAYGGAKISELGMDWGYYAVKSVVGQSLEGNQNIGAQLLMILVAPVIYGTFAFSVLKKFLNGTWRWFLFLPAGFLASTICFCGMPYSIQDIVSCCPYFAGMTVAALLLHAGYSWVINELNRRIKAKQLLSSFAIALLPAAIFLTKTFGFEPLSENLLVEIPLYFAMLFSAGIWAANIVRARKFSAAFSAAIFATFPLQIFNLANLAFGIVCSIFGSYLQMQLDWHAPLSALIITFLSAIALAAGAAAGTQFSRSRANRWLLSSRS